MMCQSCHTQYPDMCDDCKEVIHMQFPDDFPEDQLFEETTERINVASGEDVCLTME